MARELLCLEDVDPYARECTDPLQELGQDLLHRLFEEPDENLDAFLSGEQRGLGLLGMLSGPVRPNLKMLVEAECQGNPNVTKCTASITLKSGGNAGDTYTIALTLDISVDGLNRQGYRVTIQKDAAGVRIVRP